MIIRLKNADFSAKNVGKISIPGVNLNTGEGTNNPLLFKYNTITGGGEFLGVDFITKENPSVFPIIRKLHKGGNQALLYSYLTPDRSTIDFPITPSNLSMAIWINKTAWSRFQTGVSVFTCSIQVYNNGWKSATNSAGVNSNPYYISYNSLSSTDEYALDMSSTYMSASAKRKVLDTKVVNDETWVCVGLVLSNIVYNTSTYEENCRPRIALNFQFMNSDAYDMEIGNLQVVESSEYLDPKKEY